MSRVSIKTKDDLPAELQPLWDKMTTYGAFENQAGVMAHRPPIFKHTWSLLVDLADTGTLSKRHLEIALVAVSLLNKCDYCVSHHAPKLAIQGVSEAGRRPPARLRGSSGTRRRRQARRRIFHRREQQLEQDARRNFRETSRAFLRSPDCRADLAHRALRRLQSLHRYPAMRHRAGRPRAGSRGIAAVISDELNWLSAREMTRRFAEGELSPVDVLEATLAQLHRVNPALNAICLLDEPQGRRLAAESADRWRRGAPLGPLDGVPVAIKDTAHVAGWPTRIGSHTTPSSAEHRGYARRRPPARGRRGVLLQDDDARIRLEGHHAWPAHRHHAQSLGYFPHARRLQRRLGRAWWRRASCRWRPAAMAAARSGFRRRSAACSD